MGHPGPLDRLDPAVRPFGAFLSRVVRIAAVVVVVFYMVVAVGWVILVGAILLVRIR